METLAPRLAYGNLCDGFDLYGAGLSGAGFGRKNREYDVEAATFLARSLTLGIFVTLRRYPQNFCISPDRDCVLECPSRNLRSVLR